MTTTGEPTGPPATDAAVIERSWADEAARLRLEHVRTTFTALPAKVQRLFVRQFHGMPILYRLPIW